MNLIDFLYKLKDARILLVHSNGPVVGSGIAHGKRPRASARYHKVSVC